MQDRFRAAACRSTSLRLITLVGAGNGHNRPRPICKTGITRVLSKLRLHQKTVKRRSAYGKGFRHPLLYACFEFSHPLGQTQTQHKEKRPRRASC
jgi:hypothetical protein